MTAKNKRIRALLCRVLAVLGALFLVLPAFVLADGNEAPETPTIERAKAAYLYNFENDTVLFEYRSGEKLYPSSTVKLMTAIVAFEHFSEKLDTPITVTSAMLAEVSGNRIGFSEGEIVTAEEMLYCMLVNSANDAAIILAHAVAGSTSEFVKLMNEKAAWLGAYDTYYMNPTGLHDDSMVTTAKDTALIARCAYSTPGLVDITSTPKYVMPATNMNDFRNIYNRNCLVSNYYSLEYSYPGALGLNAGATTQGGYSIAAVAEDAESGLTYLAVVLGGEEYEGKYYSYVNAVNLLDWAFSAYGYAEVLTTGRTVCELPVKLSSAIDYVTLVPSESITVYLPTSVDLATDIRYSYNTYADYLDAPVESGEEAGKITVMYGDKILGSCSLVTTSSIGRSEFLYFLSRVSEFTKSRFFIGSLAGAAVLSVIYVMIKAAMREKKLRHSYRKR